MADQAQPVAKRVRLSRNKKKTWRKLSRDVDNLLPEQTKRELVKRRSGGFYIDAGASGQRQRHGQQATVAGAGKSATTSILSNLRCHQSLDASADTTPRPASKAQRRFNERPLARRVKQLLPRGADAAAVSEAAQQKPTEAAAAAAPVDHWLGPVPPPVGADEADPELLLHHLRCTRQVPVKRRFRGAPAAGPARPAPRPGASYNPSLADHRALLAEASAAEQDKQRRADRLHRQLEQHFPDTAVARAGVADAEAKEMAAGLFAQDSDSEVGEEAEPEAVVTPLEDTAAQPQSAPVPPSRKQNAEVKRQRAAATEARRLKRLSADLGQLDAVRRQVERSQLAADQLRAARAAKRRLKASGTRRLGRRKFEEPEEEFKLAEELTPCLRQLKPEGDLLVDAVKSYQRRNIIEPRARVSWRPKLPVKRFRKKGSELPGA